MSEQAVTTARSVYEAFSKGDIPSVLATFDPHIEWVEPAGSLIPGTFHGPQGVVENFMMKIPAVYGQLEILARDFMSDGDQVVVLGDYRLRGTTTVPFAHLWHVQNGKFTRYQDYTDTAAIAEAVK